MTKYKEIYKHYEQCFEQHGDSHLGVDWPSLADLNTRFEVMLDLIKDKQSHATLLDFGCGNGQLIEFLKNQNIVNIKYSGLDISEKFVRFCQEKYPEHTFLNIDLLADDNIPSFDYIICNGVFTEKLLLSHNEMFSFLKEMLVKIFSKSNCGIAFNVMSGHVDYERDDLFHLKHDQLVDFIVKNLSRSYVIRNDYGLYEYIVYIYK